MLIVEHVVLEMLGVHDDYQKQGRRASVNSEDRSDIMTDSEQALVRV